MSDDSANAFKPPSLERSSSRLKMMRMLGVSGSEVDTIQPPKMKRGTSSENVIEEAAKPRLAKKIVWPVEYVFGKEDDQNCILFENEDKKMIRAATLTKLVERLTFEEEVDPNYLFEFLLTYRSFTTGKELLSLIIDRYNIPTPTDIQEDEKELAAFQQGVVKTVRLRAYNVVKKWIEMHWYDFVEDPTLIEEVKKFVENHLMKTGMEKMGDMLIKLLAKKQEGTTNGTTIMFSHPPPEPHQPDVKQLSGLPSHLTFLAFHSEEIARQMTLIEFDLFRSIKPWECTGQSWAKKDKETKAPNILGMILRFNKVSMWVKDTLVRTENLKTRTEVLTKFIEIADRLRSLNNFNAIMELLAGLRSAAVHRLRKTWEGISSKHNKMFEELLELMSPYSNYSKFRTHLHKEISPPCIPYLGVYLTDLTFLEDGNPDTSNGLINFDKRRRTAAVIKEINQYQQTPYCLKVVPIIKGFLLAGGEYVDENQLYKLSCIIEPRENGPLVDSPSGTSPSSSPSSSPRKKWGAKSLMRKSFMLKRSDSRKSMAPLRSSQTKLTEITSVSTSSTTSASSTSPASSSPIASTSSTSPSSSSGILNKVDRSYSVDSVIETVLMAGSTSAVDTYLESLTTKTPKEKEILREEIIKLIESRQKNDEEAEEIPFDLLIGYLDEGNNAAFEKYLDGYDYYDAELIRSQTLDLWRKRKEASPTN